MLHRAGADEGAVPLEVSILTGRLGPVLPANAVQNHRTGIVSILTGRLGPVLPSGDGVTLGDGAVSILTGRLGPVLPAAECDPV